MRGRLPAPRWLLLFAYGLLTVLHIACVIPSYLSRARPIAAPTAALQPTPKPAPTNTVIIARISEQDANLWLKGQRPAVAEGVDCEDMEMQIRRSGITLSAKLRIAQLGGLTVPVEIQTMPVVRGERLHMDVLDVSLGGPYAPISGFVRSILATGFSRALDAHGILAHEGLQVSSVELEDGCIVVTSVPASSLLR